MAGSWGVCANLQGPTWHCRSPRNRRRRTTGEAGPEPALADGTAGRGPAASCPQTAWAHLPGVRSRLGHPLWSFATVFLKRQAVWERREAPLPSRPPAGPLCARFLQRQVPGTVASSPLSINPVTLVTTSCQVRRTLRQRLVQLNPERQRGLAKVAHPTRSRLASTPGRPTPSPESPLLGNFRCAHEYPEREREIR